ncbi:prion-inhibition and propagation-domain-containing protein [Hypoxylon sp. FL0543]|nr:prion-inhibition and propagation-domain-containing protein [Hypoxylon sp. FL0543]
MAEAAATAIGIAGVLSVLQSVLQCYKDFLTARDFAHDYATLQLRAALLENSITSWAVAVGLIDDSGVPCGKFLVARPTENNAKLVEMTLELIRERLDAANNELANYTSNAPTSQDVSNAEESPAVSQNDKPSRLKRAANKLHRMAHRQHDEQHPGVLKRTQWALVNKAHLEDTLNKVTALVDRLNTDFAPVNQKNQLDKYCQDIKDLKLSEEDLREIGATAGDRVFRTVLKMLECERVTGNRFVGMNITKDGTVNIGDHYDKDWDGTNMVRQQGRNDTFENLSVTDMAFVNIGDNFGGKSAVQIRLEQQQAARQAKSGT